jgi:hypothetical protein
MPGFIKDVQGREVLFKILKGLIEIVNPLLPGSIENVLFSPLEENTNSGWGINTTGLGNSCVPRSVVGPVLAILTVGRWSSYAHEPHVERRCGYL